MTGMNTTNIRNLKLGRPSNVIHVNNISNQFTDKQFHPATFPEGLVDKNSRSMLCNRETYFYCY